MTPTAVGAIPRHYNFAADILDRNLKAGRADKPAFIDPRGTWTYGQLADRVARFAASLRALGVRREERVLIALLDTIDWPTAFLGCLKAGVVAVPVNTLMTEDDYRFMLADSRARMLVVSDALYPQIPEADRREPPTSSMSSSRASRAQGHKSFEDLIESAMAEAHTAPTVRDDIAFWLYTSGSTGKPKGAVHVHADLKLTDDLYGGPYPRHHRERRLLFGGETVLRLWPRQCADLPDVGRRLHGAAAGSPDAGWRRGAPSQASGHGVLRGADLLCRVPRKPRRAAARRDEIPLLRVRRRSAAARTSASAGSSATASTFSTASARPRCCTSSCPTARAK